MRDRPRGIVARNPNHALATLYALYALYAPSDSSTTSIYLVAMRDNPLFIYLPLYRVLVCCKHRCAVYSLDEHLKRFHPKTPISKRRELLASYEHLHRVPPADVTPPAPYGPPLDALQPAQDAFLCCTSARSRGLPPL